MCFEQALAARPSGNRPSSTAFNPVPSPLAVEQAPYRRATSPLGILVAVANATHSGLGSRGRIGEVRAQLLRLATRPILPAPLVLLKPPAGKATSLPQKVAACGMLLLCDLHGGGRRQALLVSAGWVADLVLPSELGQAMATGLAVGLAAGLSCGRLRCLLHGKYLHRCCSHSTLHTW